MLENEVSSFIIEQLTSIDRKLSRQDKRIDTLVDSLQKLIEIDTETREIKASVGRLYDRVEAVEDNQNTDGCPVHNRLVEVRAEQMKAIDVRMLAIEESIDKLLVDIKTIKERPLKRMEVAIYEIIKYVTIGILVLISLKFGFNG